MPGISQPIMLSPPLKTPAGSVLKIKRIMNRNHNTMRSSPNWMFSCDMLVSPILFLSTTNMLAVDMGCPLLDLFLQSQAMMLIYIYIYIYIYICRERERERERDNNATQQNLQQFFKFLFVVFHVNLHFHIFFLNVKYRMSGFEYF